MTDANVAAIRAVCASHFGRYVGSGRWSPPNRCDSCPLRAPCLDRGLAPARTSDEIAESRERFHVAAAAILGADA